MWVEDNSGETAPVEFGQIPSPDKQRPVLVLTRGSAIVYLSRVTVAPITSSIRGVPSEVLSGPRMECVNPARSISITWSPSVGRGWVPVSRN